MVLISVPRMCRPVAPKSKDLYSHVWHSEVMFASRIVWHVEVLLSHCAKHVVMVSSWVG